jgi:hypothetical protein
MGSNVMAKKKVIEKVRRTLIFSPEYKGYLDEMPEDLKAIREARRK